MEKKFIIAFILFLVLPLCSATVNITDQGDTLHLNGGANITITPYYDNETVLLNPDNFTWVINTSTYYDAALDENVTYQTGRWGINLTSPPGSPFSEFFLKVNKLEENINCYEFNQYYTICQKYSLNFSDIITKNAAYNATYNTTTVYEDPADDTSNILYYWVNLYNVLDLDPVFESIFSAVSGLINPNQAEGSNIGARLVYNGTADTGYNSTSGSFSSLVFSNSTSASWNITLNVSTSSGGVGIVERSLEDDLAAYWTFDETFDDYYGVHNGTCTNCPSNITGVSSRALNFDGSNDDITIADDPTNLRIADNDFTIAAWIYPTAYTGNGGLNAIMTKHTGGGDDGSWLFRVVDNAATGNLPKLNFETDNPTKRYYANTPLPVDNWYHVVVTRSGSEGTFYVNGQVDGNFTDTKNLNSGTDIEFSDQGNVNNERFTGGIDEVMLYINRSLTADEIIELYKAGLSQHATTNVTLETRTGETYNISDADLDALWSFNDDSANDSTGVYNGTVYGATWGQEHGVVGGGYRFDGVDDYIEVTGAGDLRYNYAEDYTISMWFKIPVDHNNAATPLLDMRDANDDGWSVIYHSTEQLFFQLDSNDVLVDDLNDDKWHHIVISVDRDVNATFYLDGSEPTYFRQDPIAGDNMSILTTTLNIGRRRYDASSYYNGSLDDIRIYNRALSEAEAINLYNMNSMHIEDWSAWEDHGIVSDGVPVESSENGTFLQFKATLESDSTTVSPYLLGHSVLFNQFEEVITETEKEGFRDDTISAMSKAAFLIGILVIISMVIIALLILGGNKEGVSDAVEGFDLKTIASVIVIVLILLAVAIFVVNTILS